MPRWLLPLLYTAASLVCAFILPRIEYAYLPSLGLGFSASSALSVLSAIASGMMALTAIVFSIAFVMVQFSAVTYSPRIALRFASDPLLFHAMGMFAATFTYALAAMSWIDRHGSGNVQEASAMLTFVLLIASLVVFMRLVQRLTDLQITNTLRSIGDSGREVIADMFATGNAAAAVRRITEKLRPPPEASRTQVLHFEGAPLCVVQVDIAALVALAQAAGGTIVMNCAVGDTLADGAVILDIRGAASQVPEQPLRGAITLGRDRTYAQDPKYPIRMLVDIAIKALSPAINDPTTAVQAIDQIEDLLRRLARKNLDTGRFADSDGVPRLFLPMPSWDDYLSLALDEIRMFGATSVQVMRRLRHTLVSLSELLGDDPRSASVARYLAHLDSIIEASELDAVDKLSARQEDPQGLGLTRADNEA
jgi:uncharacterized membrane protein